METVSFGDFAKLQLKVAKILDVEKVEDSSQLYKLSVRVGEETRTLVAGLAGHYVEDELLGKKIVIVANLEPKVLRGIESRGMLLAAEDQAGKVSLLTVDRDVPDGSSVR